MALKQGDKGLRVRLLQQRLKGREGLRVVKRGGEWEIQRDGNGEAIAWTIDPGKIDGVYGPNTERAVASFEAMHGIDPDGNAGKRVLRRLNIRRAVRRVRRRQKARARIHTRAEWKAAPARGAIGGVVEPARTQFDHCTVTTVPGGANATIEQEAEHMRFLQKIAFGRGFFDISYSFVVMPSGRIWEARGWDKAGAHTEGFNSTAYAVAVATPCAGESLSQAVVDAFAEVGIIGIKNGAYAGDLIVRNHNEVAAKSCPGKFISDRKGAIQARARAGGKA